MVFEHIAHGQQPLEYVKSTAYTRRPAYQMFNPKFNPSHFFPIVQPFVTAIYLLTMSTKSYPHVLVVGAGMSGLTLAHQLKTANISFSIFERDPTSDARTQGWALSLFGPALADLVESMPEEMVVLVPGVAMSAREEDSDWIMEAESPEEISNMRAMTASWLSSSTPWCTM